MYVSAGQAYNTAMRADSAPRPPPCCPRPLRRLNQAALIRCSRPQALLCDPPMRGIAALTERLGGGSQAESGPLAAPLHVS
jgi:hypothetical protein